MDLKIAPEGLKTLTIKIKVRSSLNLYSDRIFDVQGNSKPLEVFLIDPDLNCPLFVKSFGYTKKFTCFTLIELIGNNIISFI